MQKITFLKAIYFSKTIVLKNRQLNKKFYKGIFKYSQMKIGK